MASFGTMRVDLVFPSHQVIRDYYRGLIYLAARTCYSEMAPQEIWAEYCEGKVDPAKVIRVINHVIESGHHSTIEHISFTFAISGVSRSLSHQLVRHRIGVSFDQQSQRYVKLREATRVVPPTIEESEPARTLFEEAMKTEERAYQQLLDLGTPPEDARFVLPNATTTNLIMTVNLRELIHMAGLRICLLAQWEIRQLFKLIRRELMAADEFFGRLVVPKCVPMGVCDEKRNEDGHCRVRPHRNKVLEVWRDYKEGRLRYVEEKE